MDKERDLTEEQIQGDRLACVMDMEEGFARMMTLAIEKASVVNEKIESAFQIDGKEYTAAVLLEYRDKENDELGLKIILTQSGEDLVFTSMYPRCSNGVKVKGTLSDICEWENGLESWLEIEVQTEDESRSFCFFDTDYLEHKDSYVIGNEYTFELASICSQTEKPETSGFTFEGQQAIDFREKLGDTDHYDENGAIRPVEFSTAELSMCLQTGSFSPDAHSFITPITSLKKVKGLKNEFLHFEITLKDSGGEVLVKIPAYQMLTDENKSLLTDFKKNKVKQLQGGGFLIGFLSE